MAKAGEAYQEAVAEVLRTLYPNSEIKVGAWVEGPDGRRDLDVFVRPGGVQDSRFYLIECKDWKRPVGIGAIDALDSKRQDLGAELAMICSNSGFTGEALRKATRKRIPALSALIEGDSRIRVIVEEEIYTRKIKVDRCESTWHFLVENVSSLIPPNTSARDIMFQGRQVAAWVRDKCVMLVGMSAKSSTVEAKYSFRRPIQFHIRQAILPVIGCTLSISVTTQWCSQVIKIGASTGMYDYLRQRLLLGMGTQQYHMKEVDFDKWIPIDFVPEHLVSGITMQPNEIRVTLALMDGIDTVDDAPAPDIDAYIEKENVSRAETAEKMLRPEQ